MLSKIRKPAQIRAGIEDCLKVYLELFPSEIGATKLFADFLSKTTQDELFTRKNFDGHITTSAFIVNKDRSEMLLLKHKSLNKWLQPGGHFEGDETLLASALREAEEETGIPKAELHNLSVHPISEVQFDIDSHYIPANPMKNEDGHYHHDLRYLFEYKGDGSNSYNPDESTGMKWVSFADLADDPIFLAVVKKIEKVFG